jgi:hypothetical protein
MKLTYQNCIAAFCIAMASSSFAQTSPLPKITYRADTVVLEKLLNEFEKQSGYRIFYNSEELDTAHFSLSVNALALDSALSSVLSAKGIRFSIDNNKNVFVTRGRQIYTSVPMVLYEPKTAPVKTGFYEELSEQEIAAANKQKALLENKLFEIGEPSKNSTGVITVTGYVKDAKTGEPIVGAAVMVDKLKVGSVTDQFGYYTIQLPKGQHVLSIQSIGMADTKRQLLLKGDGKLNIDLNQQVTTLRNVTISSQKLSNIKGTTMGVQKLDIKTIKQVPVAFGEADLLKVVLTLPGVKSVGEASTGLNVRGGSADQNLILFNDATIYNPSHFFGLFSAFNPEVVKDVQLYKSSIPAKYGGRLSSVLDISSREGNKKKITGSAGVGLLTTRLNLEGPLIKDKTSFIIGGRTTYANWLLKQLPQEYRNSKASFNDLNLNINHEINKKSSLYLTGYLSNDRFNLNSDTFYTYGNRNISLKYKQVFNNKLNGLFTAGYDKYQYNISSDFNPVNAYKLAFDINQSYFKAHFNYYLSAQHSLEFGLNSIYYKLHPGSYSPVGKGSLVAPDEVQTEKGLESALYLSDRWNVSRSFSVDGGIRFSMFNYLGAQTINEYAPGLPRTEANITGTKQYGNNQFIKTYGGPEYRLALRYAFNDSFSIKAGLNTQRQYIHTLSNTTAMAPTDIRKLSDPNIKPQYGEQVSLGLYKNLKSNTIEISAEVYYKRIYNFIDFKSGAVLVMNKHVETEVLNTKGKAYGVELMIKKLSGKLNGWLSYTYSRTLLKQDDPIAGELINHGEFYPANYDKPHDVTFIGNYRFSHRFSFSLNATYSTGRPITLPVGTFYYAGSIRTLYADRNSFRIPDYFRTDASFNIENGHKLTQWLHSSWTFGVYNITGRRNPYSVYFVSEGGVVNGYKLSIFGNAIPYINLNITF